MLIGISLHICSLLEQLTLQRENSFFNKTAFLTTASRVIQHITRKDVKEHFLTVGQLHHFSI